jgi:hypothetical protein
MEPLSPTTRRVYLNVIARVNVVGIFLSVVAQVLHAQTTNLPLCAAIFRTAVVDTSGWTTYRSNIAPLVFRGPAGFRRQPSRAWTGGGGPAAPSAHDSARQVKQREQVEFWNSREVPPLFIRRVRVDSADSQPGTPLSRKGELVTCQDEIGGVQVTIRITRNVSGRIRLDTGGISAAFAVSPVDTVYLEEDDSDDDPGLRQLMLAIIGSVQFSVASR